MNIETNAAVSRGLRDMIWTHYNMGADLTDSEHYILAQLALCVIYEHCQPMEVIPVGYLRDLLTASGISAEVAARILPGAHDIPVSWDIF